MSVGTICQHKVRYATRKTTVPEAARLMRRHHVGDLVVVDNDDDEDAMPIGIVTDRDLVLEVLAADVDPKTVCVEDVMARNLTTIHASADIYDAVQLMRKKGIRRLPVVDDRGVLIGIIALDDLMGRLATEMRTLSRVMPQGGAHEALWRS